MRLASDDRGILPWILGLGIIFIAGLIIMAFKPEFVIPGFIILAGLAIWAGIAYMGGAPGKKVITGSHVKIGIVIMIVCVILASILFAFPGLFKFEIGAPGDYQTNTKSFTLNGLKGTGTHTDGDEKEEVLDDHIYVAAWTQNDLSEKIVIQGKLIVDSGFAGGIIDEAKYVIYLTSSDSWGTPVKEYTNLNVYSGSFQIGAEVVYEHKIFEIQGAFDGWLKAEFWVRFGGAFGGWGKMALDCAKVENGKGEVNFERGIYQIGEKAELELDLGYAKGQYKLEVQATTTGEMLFDGFLDEGLEGRVTHMSFEIKSSHVGIGTWPNCPENTLEAKLWNELVSKDQHETAVTDIKTLGPGKPDVELSSPKDGKAYRTGEIITITIKGKPNAQTQAPIKEYRIHISPTDTVEENSDGTFTFQPATRGTYKIMASCQDATCRRSEVVTKEIHVYDAGEDPPFIEEGEFPWAVILILVAALIGLLLAVAILKEKKVKGVKLWIIALAVFLLILIIGLWFTGGIKI